MDSTGQPSQNSWKWILKLGFSLVLLVGLFYFTGVEKTWETLKSADLSALPLAVFLYVLSQAISAFRWQFLSRLLHFQGSWMRFFQLYMMGMYFNLFLPGSIGGDVGRLYYLAKWEGRQKREALLTLLAERGVGLVALLILTGTFCLLPATSVLPYPIRLGVLSLSACLIIGYGLLHVLPLNQWQKTHSNNPWLNWMVLSQPYWQNTPVLLASIGLSLFVHGLMVWIHVLIAQSLHLEISFIYLAAVYGLTTLISVAPLFFNGIGLREGAYQYLLSLVGASLSQGIVFGLYWLVISLITSGLGSLFYITAKREKIAVSN